MIDDQDIYNVVESKDPNQVSANPASDQNVKKSVVKDKPKDDGSSSSSDSEEEKKKEDKPQKSSVKRKSIKKKKSQSDSDNSSSNSDDDSKVHPPKTADPAKVPAKKSFGKGASVKKDDPQKYDEIKKRDEEITPKSPVKNSIQIDKEKESGVITKPEGTLKKNTDKKSKKEDPLSQLQEAKSESEDNHDLNDGLSGGSSVYSDDVNDEFNKTGKMIITSNKEPKKKGDKSQVKDGKEKQDKGKDSSDSDSESEEEKKVDKPKTSEPLPKDNNKKTGNDKSSDDSSDSEEEKNQKPKVVDSKPKDAGSKPKTDKKLIKDDSSDSSSDSEKDTNNKQKASDITPKPDKNLNRKDSSDSSSDSEEEQRRKQKASEITPKTDKKFDQNDSSDSSSDSEKEQNQKPKPSKADADAKVEKSKIEDQKQENKKSVLNPAKPDSKAAAEKPKDNDKKEELKKQEVEHKDSKINKDQKQENKKSVLNPAKPDSKAAAEKPKDNDKKEELKKQEVDHKDSKINKVQKQEVKPSKQRDKSSSSSSSSQERIKEVKVVDKNSKANKEQSIKDKQKDSIKKQVRPKSSDSEESEVPEEIQVEVKPHVVQDKKDSIKKQQKKADEKVDKDPKLKKKQEENDKEQSPSHKREKDKKGKDMKEVKNDEKIQKKDVNDKGKDAKDKSKNIKASISKKERHSSQESDHRPNESDQNSKKVQITDKKSLIKFISSFESIKPAERLLKKTGYKFVIDADKQEVLCNAKTGERFKFVDDPSYKLTADLVNEYIRMRILEQFEMEEKMIPFSKDMTDKEYSTAPIFISPDWKTNTKAALVLIQGTGDVRAGLWARSVCINDSLDKGSMLPQIKFAVENDMACLIMNPNYHEDKKGNPVDPRVSTMEKHCNYVFKKFVVGRCQAEKVYIIAHSAGGRCLTTLYKRFTQEFHDRVKSIVLTDSAHKDIRNGLIDQEEEDFMVQVCIHFVKSYNKIGEKEDNSQDPIMPTFSAGHSKHEYTTGCSWPKIQNIFKNMSNKELKKVDLCCFSKASYRKTE